MPYTRDRWGPSGPMTVVGAVDRLLMQHMAPGANVLLAHAAAAVTVAIVTRPATYAGVLRMARSMEISSDRDSAPSLRRMRATWCSTVLAEMSSWLPMSR